MRQLIASKAVIAASTGDVSQLNDEAIKKSVTNSLISRALLLQQAKKSGFELSDQQVAQLIRQEPTFQQDGKYSDELFQNYLRSTQTSLAQILNDVREQVALRQLAGGINDSGLASKFSILIA